MPTAQRIRSKKRWSAKFPLPTDEASDTVHGMKQLSYENFLAPSLGAMQFSPYGGFVTAGLVIPSAQEVRARVERFSAVTLPSHVPETVWRMFAVAKGAMTYGLFFYPLYTLGEDHLSRLFEWIVKERYTAISGKKEGRNLKMALDWLLKRQHFPPGSDVRWLAAYRIRNNMAHPTMQYITSPAEASRSLHQMRELIAHLYPDKDATMETRTANGNLPLYRKFEEST